MIFGEWHVQFLDAEHLTSSWCGYRSRPAFLLSCRSSPGINTFLAPDGTGRDIKDGEQMPPECLWFVPEGCEQAILDALWERGLRPKDRRYEEESKLLREVMSAKDAHISDLQKVAFKPDEKWVPKEQRICKDCRWCNGTTASDCTVQCDGNHSAWRAR